MKFYRPILVEGLEYGNYETLCLYDPIKFKDKYLNNYAKRHNFRVVGMI